MNVEVRKDNLSPFGALIVKGSRLIVTDQNTMGKPLGVAEGSAKALGKTTAFSVPEAIEQETMVMPEQVTVAAPDQGVILEGAVPAYENVAVPQVDSINMDIPETAFVGEPANTPEAVSSFAQEPSPVPVEVPVDITPNEIPMTSANDMLVGDTGAIQQYPLLNEEVNEEESIVLENPVNRETKVLPEPERLDNPVQIEGDQFNIPLTLPEDGKDKDNNPNLDSNGPEGLVIDLPSYTGVQEDSKKENTNSITEQRRYSFDFQDIEKIEVAFNEEIISVVSEIFNRYFKQLNEAFANAKEIGSKYMKDNLQSVDTTVADGLRKIQEAVGTTTIAPTADETVVVPDQEAPKVL